MHILIYSDNTGLLELYIFSSLASPEAHRKCIQVSRKPCVASIPAPFKNYYAANLPNQEDSDDK